MKISSLRFHYLHFIGRLLRAIGWRCYAYAERLSPTPLPEPTERERLMERWLSDEGDKRLRQEYELGPNDIVLDVGGYEGQWSSDIVARYGCQVHVFEPVPHFAGRIRDRFARNNAVIVHEAALGSHDGSMTMYVDADASSEFGEGQAIQVSVLGLTKLLLDKKIDEIALMKINIEGGEYALLEGLIANGLITSIRELQIQFHDFVPNAKARMVAIQEKLSITHHLTYQYPFIWENWHRVNVA